jgi:hypothetical protein
VAEAATAGRSLDELAPHNMLIRVQYTQTGPFSFDGCPDNIAEQALEKQEQHTADAELSNATVQATVSRDMRHSDILQALSIMLYIQQLQCVRSTALCCAGGGRENNCFYNLLLQ